MGVQTFYRPVRDDQLKTTIGTRTFNCGPCATRVLIRRWSLGSMNPSIAAIRKGAGNLVSWFSNVDVAEALRYFGIPCDVYNRAGNFEIADLAAWLKAGNYGVALGDYEKVPDSLSGDPNFDGNHFVFLNEWAQLGPLCYDPIADGRRKGIPVSPLTWPWYILTRYAQNLSDRFDEDLTLILVKRRTVKRRFDSVQVFAGPDPASGVIGTWRTGPLEYGALTRGVAPKDPPNPAWYRVWWPYTARIGFVNQSQVTLG